MAAFIRVAFEEGFERAAGRTADPSTSVGMTRGEGSLRLGWLVDGGTCYSPISSESNPLPQTTFAMSVRRTGLSNEISSKESTVQLIWSGLRE